MGAPIVAGLVGVGVVACVGGPTLPEFVGVGVVESVGNLPPIYFYNVSIFI